MNPNSLLLDSWEPAFTVAPMSAPHEIPDESLPPLDRLRQIMHILRAPGGCSWDAEQTHESLVPHLIEESYEVAEAIRKGDRAEIVDELGDLLLQPVFHAEIAAESGAFDLDDVASAICEKLIRRHPHVFGDADADNPDAVLKQWDEIKKTEKSDDENAVAEPFLKKSNEGMPALMASQKMQRKVAKIGFDWPDAKSVLEKLDEELDEMREALDEDDRDHLADEIGDVLFVTVNLARKCGFDAETLMAAANAKFVRRFQGVERVLVDQGKAVEDSTLGEMEAAWQEVKRIEQEG